MIPACGPRRLGKAAKEEMFMSAAKSSHLAALGVFGFDAVEPVVLAALITEDPLLLVGNSGTGKTFIVPIPLGYNS